MLLEGDFSVPPKIRILFKVTLTPLGIFYSQISTISSQYEEKFVQISDVIGCHCGSANVSPTPRRSDNTASFTVYSYPFRKKLFSGKKTRHRVAVTFETDQFATFEENHIHVLRWKNVINCLSRGIHINRGGESPPLCFHILPSLFVCFSSLFLSRNNFFLQKNFLDLWDVSFLAMQNYSPAIPTHMFSI